MFWKYCKWLAKCAGYVITTILVGLAGGDTNLGEWPPRPRRTLQDYPYYKPTARRNRWRSNP